MNGTGQTDNWMEREDMGSYVLVYIIQPNGEGQSEMKQRLGIEAGQAEEESTDSQHK